jgi:hypothetical protein
MGKRTKKGSDSVGITAIIPGAGFAWFQGYWRIWNGSEWRYVAIVDAKFGEPHREIVVPEYLIDRRGHNTNVLHAKYLSFAVDIEVTCSQYWYVQDWLRGGDFVVMHDWDGTHETYWVVEEDEKYITFGRIKASYSTRNRQCEGWEFHTKFTKNGGNIGHVVADGSSWNQYWYPKDYDTDPESQEAAVERVRNYIATHSVKPKVFTTSNAPLMSVAKLDQVNVKSKAPNPSCAFLLGEVGHEVQGRELRDVIYPAMREAYLDGISTFPKMADNNIANFMEIGEMIFDAMHGDLSAVPDTLGGLWMWYRYQYSTTRSDVEAAMSYWDRLKQGIENGAKYHGRVSARAAGLDVEVRWSGSVGLNTDDMQTLMAHRLWSAGLEPTLYTGWDLVPFSFVADWFLDIGDQLEGMDQERHAYADYYVQSSCYSFHYVRELSGNPVECYYRFYHPPKQAQGECYYSSRGTPSVMTWLKRAADSTVLTGADQKVLRIRTFKL